MMPVAERLGASDGTSQVGGNCCSLLRRSLPCFPDDPKLLLLAVPDLGTHAVLLPTYLVPPFALPHAINPPLVSEAMIHR